jgi:hypothetical protein
MRRLIEWVDKALNRQVYIRNGRKEGWVDVFFEDEDDTTIRVELNTKHDQNYEEVAMREWQRMKDVDAGGAG